MSSKLVGVQIAKLAYARTERRDVHRSRRPQRATPIRAFIAATVHRVARARALAASNAASISSHVRRTISAAGSRPAIRDDT
jgi:hypothetical protein